MLLVRGTDSRPCLKDHCKLELDREAREEDSILGTIPTTCTY